MPIARAPHPASHISVQRILATGVAVVLMWSATPPAQASIFSGSCPIQVNFTFESRVSGLPTLSAPGYSVTISNYSGIPCVVAPDLAQPLRLTSGGGNGSSSIWTCEATLGQGSWSQSWGSGFPAVTSGSHLISGTWGSWTMLVRSSSLNFIGLAELTINPSQASGLVQCEQSGISSLSMIGTMVFQDP